MKRTEFQCILIKECKNKHCDHYPRHSKKSDCNEECDDYKEARCELKKPRRSYHKR